MTKNNKTAAWIRLILASLAVVFLTGLLVYALLGKKSLFLIGFSYFHIYKNSEYSAEDFQEGNLKLEANDLQKIELNRVSGTLYLEVYDGDVIEITSDDAQYGPYTYYQDGILVITDIQPMDYGFTLGVSFGSQEKTSGDIRVRIPKDISEVQVLNIDTVSGNMYVTGLQTENVEIDTVSADVFLTLEVTPQVLSLDSVSGSLQLVIPSGKGFNCEWDTVSGRLNSSLFLTDQEGDGEVWTYLDGASSFSFDTASGNVNISPLSGD